MLSYQFGSIASIPGWLLLARLMGKKGAWLIGVRSTPDLHIHRFFTSARPLAGMAVGIGAFSLGLPPLHPGFYPDDEDARLRFSLVSAALVGASNTCGQVIARSLMADVIDWDEQQTGCRREGAYFAFFNFLTKGAAGVGSALMGWLLGFAGFVPNVEQTMQVKFAMAFLFCLLPMVGLAVAIVLFRRFSLREGMPERQPAVPYQPPRIVQTDDKALM
eukprot:4200807-Prymnesium_polylepis.1